ncbi:PilZ domain-containing protein [Pseudomonas abieticivorans]|uniref:PilZ domain-containing protein n=1 Tax=Pseudomonas abieticivorans TaxID=2931382 RepID=UPI0020BE17C6|nr:PilZ domain-containing protein [Pseudomonas sp. PIA16]
MGRFLPHPFNVPVELSQRPQPSLTRQRLHTISLGGVACNYPRALRSGTAVNLRMPTLGNDACYPGYVAWCRKQEDGYRVAIAFTDEQTLFGARMGEQLCHIRQYCEDNAEQAGLEQLAQQWVALHASEFSHASLNLPAPLPLPAD